MGLRMGERRALTEPVARCYRSASKQEKAVMLGEFVEPSKRCTAPCACW